MSAHVIDAREAIIRKVNQVDASELTIVEAVVDALLEKAALAEFVEYNEDGSEMTEEQKRAWIAELDRRSDDFEKNGGGVPAEQVHRRIETWLADQK